MKKTIKHYSKSAKSNAFWSILFTIILFVMVIIDPIVAADLGRYDVLVGVLIIMFDQMRLSERNMAAHLYGRDVLEDKNPIFEEGEG